MATFSVAAASPAVHPNPNLVIHPVFERPKLAALREIQTPSTWTIEKKHYAGMKPEKIAALRTAVAGKPQHPDRAMLESAERRVRLGPDVETVTIYFGKDGSLRYNSTQPSGAFSDVVITSDLIWTMTDTTLALIDPNQPAPAGRNFSGYKGRARNDARQFIDGVLTALPSDSIQFLDRKDPLKFTIKEKRSESQFQLELFDPSDSYGRSLELISSTTIPTEVGWKYEAIGTWENPQDGIRFQMLRDFISSDTLKVEAKLLAFSPAVPDGIFKPPTKEDTSDAIRGKVSILGIDDLRNLKNASYSVRKSEGEKWQEIKEGPDPIHELRSTYSIAGYIAAVAAVVGVLGWAMLKRRE